jgi:hypothetical protein
MRCHRDRNAAINRMRFAASSAVTVSREEAEVRSGCGDAYDRAVNAARNIPRVSLKRQALRLDRLPAVGDVKILQVFGGRKSVHAVAASGPDAGHGGDDVSECSDLLGGIEGRAPAKLGARATPRLATKHLGANCAGGGRTWAHKLEAGYA